MNGRWLWQFTWTAVLNQQETGNNRVDVFADRCWSEFGLSRLREVDLGPVWYIFYVFDLSFPAKLYQFNDN
jgi:hypothetical protein